MPCPLIMDWVINALSPPMGFLVALDPIHNGLSYPLIAAAKISQYRLCRPDALIIPLLTKEAAQSTSQHRLAMIKLVWRTSFHFFYPEPLGEFEQSKVVIV